MAACCISECVNGMSWLRNAKLSSVHLLIPSSSMLGWPQKYLFQFRVFNIFHILTASYYGLQTFLVPYEPEPHSLIMNPRTLRPLMQLFVQQHKKGAGREIFCVDKALILIMTNCFSRIQHYSYSWPSCYWSKIIYMPENRFFTFTLIPLCTSFYILAFLTG